MSWSSVRSPAVLANGPRPIQAIMVVCSGRLAYTVALLVSSPISRSRSGPVSGWGNVAWGSNRSNVAASNCDELPKWR